MKKPKISDNLFQPIKAPKVSGNLLNDPRIADILQPPELRKESEGK